MGPFIREYVKDEVPDHKEGLDIITHQNNRGLDATYDCVLKARRTPGLSCHGRNYLGRWFRKMGGETSVPCCKGMDCMTEMEF